MADLVVLTGISGFLGGHVALELLKQGFAVRGSVRDLGRADKVRAWQEPLLALRSAPAPVPPLVDIAPVRAGLRAPDAPAFVAERRIEAKWSEVFAK